jgi:hypothetical protein
MSKKRSLRLTAAAFAAVAAKRRRDNPALARLQDGTAYVKKALAKKRRTPTREEVCQAKGLLVQARMRDTADATVATINACAEAVTVAEELLTRAGVAAGKPWAKARALGLDTGPLIVDWQGVRPREAASPAATTTAPAARRTATDPDAPYYTPKAFRDMGINIEDDRLRKARLAGALPGKPTGAKGKKWRYSCPRAFDLWPECFPRDWPRT